MLGMLDAWAYHGIIMTEWSGKRAEETVAPEKKI